MRPELLGHAEGAAGEADVVAASELRPGRQGLWGIFRVSVFVIHFSFVFIIHLLL